MPPHGECSDDAMSSDSQPKRAEQDATKRHKARIVASLSRHWGSAGPTGVVPRCGDPRPARIFAIPCGQRTGSIDSGSVARSRPGTALHVARTVPKGAHSAHGWRRRRRALFTTQDGTWAAQVRRRDKPNSVSLVPYDTRRGNHLSRTTVTRCLMRPTRRYTGEQPASDSGNPGPLLPLSGLAPDGVYRGQPVTRLPVSSYLAISPLPASGKHQRAVCFCGTFLRVAPTGR